MTDQAEWHAYRINYVTQSGGSGSTTELGRDAEHAIERFIASQPRWQTMARVVAEGRAF